MTQTQKFEVTPLARVAIKVSGIVIWRVHSESGSDYNVVVVDGHVSSCETTTGEPCKGFRYHQGKCHHAALVLEREQERHNFSSCKGCGHLKHGVIADYTCDQCRAQEQEAREKLPLNGNRPFSLMR